jgi:tRNA/tmRNA/rRNA uracil-C5-methylase (TrmA/RlmC/RlmD family)
VTVRLVAEAMAHGGRAVAHHDGQVVFIEGAYPGESVHVEVTGSGKRHLFARVTSVEEPSPARVEAPCIHFGSCGGCQWQSAGYGAQLEWKRAIVSDQLAHLGGMPDAGVRNTIAPGPPYGYRNRMDFKLVRGRPALSRAASHELVTINKCHLMVPPLEALFHALPARPEARSVIIRAGAATGQTLAMYDDETGVIEEVVAGCTFRITGRAFFQNNTAGAEALVGLVREALEPGRTDVLVDGYAGGGLFSATVGRACQRVIGVESDRIAAADFEHNVGVRALRKKFESSASLLPKAFDLAVVDPPRSGLGKEAVGVLTGGTPRRIAYVSCDPASFARDARLLGEQGYALAWVQPVDMFPQTFHVEMVGCFEAGWPEAGALPVLG